MEPVPCSCFSIDCGSVAGGQPYNVVAAQTHDSSKPHQNSSRLSFNAVSASLHGRRVQYPIVDPSGRAYNMQRVFDRAIRGQGDQDMAPNLTGVCAVPAHVASQCGNRRGLLSECRCPALNRKDGSRTHMRESYESRVVQSILQHPAIKRNEPFNLAIFCSGWLLGEEILLFKLVHALRSQNYTGRLTVTFIDRAYKSVVTRKNPFESGVGKAVYQLLREMGLVCKPMLKVVGQDPSTGNYIVTVDHSTQFQFQGHFFAEADAYTAAVRTGACPRHHFIIAADTSGKDGHAYPLLGPIDQAAKRSDALPPLVLEKTEGGVVIATVDPRGDLTNQVALATLRAA